MDVNTIKTLSDLMSENGIIAVLVAALIAVLIFSTKKLFSILESNAKASKEAAVKNSEINAKLDKTVRSVSEQTIKLSEQTRGLDQRVTRLEDRIYDDK